MNIKKTIATVAAIVAIPALFFAGIVQATVPPSIERGDIYYGKNLTKNTELGDPITADKCDELLYKVRVHNPGPTETATNVTVQVAFPTAASTQNISLATIKADNIYPTSASDSATVNLSSSQKISYVPGSTQLLDANSNVISGLPDAIVGAGVNIGSVGVSINEKRFVQFKAKVSCPTPPAPEKPSEKPVTPAAAAPTSLPNTGPGDVAAAFVGISTASGAAYHFIRRRLGL